MADDIIDDEEKQQKPKKFAEIHVTVWDDGELDMDCVRFKPRPSGRGAPRKIILEDKKRFIKEVDMNAMSKYGLLKFIKEELSITAEDEKPTVKPETKNTETFDDEDDE